VVEVQVARPVTNGTAAQMVAAPSRNVTAPDASAVLGASPLTTAESTTGWPNTAAVTEPDSTICAVPAETVTLAVAEAPAEKSALPT